MDRGRNLEALTEDAEEEEMEERKGSSDDSDSDDEEPDPSARREPNKFDNLCDGVANAMALMHVSLQELLEMKDEMLKHSLPPPLLIKLATITGKVFRSVSDLNMPVNELVRLVRVYSTPWEEKSAALKKLHEDYESKQRQLNIAVKRLQLVDAHSKRIAREKRIMNWEKLFAKIMSNKGHGRRWKFLIETIKQKAKLGLEHVQEYTKQLEESSDEEEEDDDDMPMTVKGRGEGSDKLSDLEEGEEDEEKASGTQEKVSTEDDEENIDIEEIEEEPRQGSPKKVRFAAPEEPPKDVYVKPPMEDASIGTSDTYYDHYLFIRVYKPSKIEETELKCTITFGEQIKKTKRLDIPLEDIPETGTEEAKPKGKGLIGLRAKAPVVEDKTAEYKKEAQLRRAEQIYKTKYEELQFDINQYFGQDHIWRAGKKDEPQELKISMHTGQLEEMFAMATVDFGDLKELDLKTVYLPEPHGDDDVPKPPGDDSESVISEEIDILLPDEDTATEYKPPVEKYEVLKKVEPAHFPIYYLNPKSNNVHEPAGMLPLVIYLGRKAKPPVWNRQCGTMTFNDLMFDVAGIDITTWKREDMFKETQSRAASAMEWQPEVQVKVVEKEVIKEVIVQQDPVIVEVEKKPEPVKTPEPVKAKTPEPVKAKTPEPVKEKTPEPVEPLEEMVTKSEYNQLALKHSEELQLVQSEYEKRLQELLDNLQQMQQAQLEQKQQLQSHSRPPLVHQRPVSSSSRHSSAKSEKRTETNTLTPATVPMLTPQNKLTTQVPTIPDSQPPIVHPPETDNMNGSLSEQRLFTKRRHKLGKPLPAPLAPGVPEDFLSRLAWFEESSKRHQEEVYERTIRQVKEDIEKKLAGQHKLSKKEEEIYDAMKDVSLPALFMPTKMNAVFNPRAHQYFHPTGSTDMRLTQPPSVFQLPPLPHKTRMSVVNLFDLSRNFNRKGQQWLMDRYIQQQEPVANVHGTVPQTPAPTVAPQVGQSNPQTPQNDSQTSLHGTINQGKKLDAEM